MSRTIFRHTIFHTPSVTYHHCHIPSFTYNFVTHHLCHIPSFTHNFVTHHLSHPSLSHTIFHIQLSDTPSFTHHLSHTIFVTYHHSQTTLSHTIFVTYHLSHTALSRTIFRHTIFHTPSFTHHLSHTIFVTYHLSHATLSHTIFVTYHLSHTMSRTILHFAWQAWHNLTSTLVPRGRRGTISHPPSFCVAGVAQSHIHLGFAWQAWHSWHWVARLGWFWSPVTPRHFAWQAWHNLTSTLVPRGRRGTISHPLSFCVAGLTQSHIHLRFAWQAWRSWHWVARLGWFWSPVTPRHFAWQAWHNLTSTLVPRGRPDAISHPLSFCVAGVAQSHIHLRFAWQAWHLWHWVARLGWFCSPVTPRHFAWQAWHNLASTLVSRGRRGAISHPLSFCVAGVAQSHLHLRFAWQAWHLGHWVARLGWFWSPVTPRHFAWQAWHNLTSTLVPRGRRGPISHPLSFCVAGLAQSHIHLRFAWQAWQAWHLWHWVARLGWFWSPVTPRHFAWQAWHNLTSTLVPRGRRGTISHPLSFRVAGVAQSHIQWFLMPSFTHNFVTHTYIHTHIHTYMHTIFSHTFLLCHTPSFTFHFVTHNCFNFSILHRLLSLSFPVPATTFDAHYWEKLTCGVIRSFNSRNPRFFFWYHPSFAFFASSL